MERGGVAAREGAMDWTSTSAPSRNRTASSWFQSLFSRYVFWQRQVVQCLHRAMKFHPLLLVKRAVVDNVIVGHYCHDAHCKFFVARLMFFATTCFVLPSCGSVQ